MKKLIGNAVVGQSGGPTAAINATLAGVIRGVKEDVGAGAIKTLYGMRNGVEGLLQERLINLNEYFDCEDKIVALEHTPAAALGSCRKKLPKLGEDDALYEKLLAIFKKYDIRYFFYIGGNDSMDTVDKLSKYFASVGSSIRVMGVPKTIDNDLPVTDHCPGFGSAAKYIATSLKEIIRDNEAYEGKTKLILVEIMGRHAGWLTGAAGLAKGEDCTGVDAIYLPERIFDIDAFVEKIKDLATKKSSIVIAVSEGVKMAESISSI
mgnify:CR=1 FL=1